MSAPRLLFETSLKALPLPLFLKMLKTIAPLLPRFLKIHPKNCLEESLLCFAREARAGKSVQIAIGIKKDMDSIQAHAWTESPGEEKDENDGFKRIGRL